MLRHGIYSDSPEEFAEAIGDLRQQAVLAGGAVGRRLERIADCLEGLDVRPVAPAPPAEPVFTSFSRGEA